MPRGRVAYIHIAGHYNEAPDLIVDSHAAAVIDPVWKLLDTAYAEFGVLPTLLERDFKFPPLAELIGELDQVRAIQRRHGRNEHNLQTVPDTTADARHVRTA
jgi:uncharacterized protein (UPF0276 family)